MKDSRFPILMALMTWLATAGAASAAPGDLDPAFAGDGTVLTAFGAPVNVQGVAVQADAKVIVVGTHTPTSYADILVVRYKEDGTLDPTFGGDGIVFTDLNALENDRATAVLVQDDGKILVGGSSDSDFALLRYEPDGDLDPTFGTGGVVTTDFDGGGDAGMAIAIYGDGRIVLAGSTAVPGFKAFAVARYHDDGSPDETFDGDGRATTRFREVVSGDERANAVMVQPDGAIIAAGISDNNIDYVGALARYLEDGSLDPSFGGDGKVTVEQIREITAASLAAGGKVVFAGFNASESDAGIVVGRLGTDGLLDPTFGSAGIATADSLGTTDIALAMAVEADERIVVAGLSEAAFAVVRFLPNGGLDTGFGSGGRVTTQFSQDWVLAYVYGLAVDSQGRIVAAGGDLYGAENVVAVARYQTAACSGDGECVDANPCTLDRCEESGCENVEEPVDPELCYEAGKTSILIRDSAEAGADQIKWQWKKGDAFDYASLGDPSDDTGHTLCVYDTTGGVSTLAMSMTIPPSAELWKSAGGKGWTYGDALGEADGTTKLQIKAGASGKTKIKLSGGGENLVLPGAFDVSSYFDQDPEVVVQLIGHEGACWTSGFDGASVNSATSFKAK